jgi:hypothetical protein
LKQRDLAGGIEGGWMEPQKQGALALSFRIGECAERGVVKGEQVFAEDRKDKKTFFGVQKLNGSEVLRAGKR